MKIFIHESYNARQTSSEILAQALALKHGWGTFSYTPEGRPHVDHGYVSISHSKHFWVLSYDHHAHGIDIEVQRPLKQTLIKRFNLNVRDPLFDWCSREAYFKLCQREDALFYTLPKMYTAHRIKHSHLCIALVNTSKHLHQLEIQKYNV